MHNSVTQEQYVIWDNIGLSNNSMAMHKDFMQFNQAHTFSIVFNNKNNTRDYYHFAAKLGQESMNGVYLQKIDILKKFILYFHDQISKHKHLKAAYSKKISINKKIGGYFHEILYLQVQMENLS
jgi:hypothetical protein